MTGRDKIQAAFAPEGTPEIPAVICYEDIYYRDHWAQLTGLPWWYGDSPDIAHQLAWRRDVIRNTGQDWFRLPQCPSRQRRRDLSIDVRPDGVYRLDRATGRAERLEAPRVGGGLIPEGAFASVETAAEIDARIAEPPPFDVQAFAASGRADLAEALLAEVGAQLYPITHISSALWSTYSLWGFGGMMTMIATRPDLVTRACERYLAWSLYDVQVAAALGAQAIWIEECMTDMISPADFAAFNLPYLRRLVEAIRAAGMQSIYYYCGNPAGKWEHLLDAGADAVALEEGKKGFAIDIEDVVERVRGRCTVLGNLDAIGVLQDGSEAELRAEIARQIAAGRRNGSRFILSVGSSVTPGTPVEQVRLYCDLAHELGKG
jgi:hypothetical protein